MKFLPSSFLAAFLAVAATSVQGTVRWDGVFLQTDFSNTLRVGDTVTNASSVAFASSGNTAQYPDPTGQIPAHTNFGGQIRLSQSVIGHAVAPVSPAPLLAEGLRLLAAGVAYGPPPNETSDHVRTPGDPWVIKFSGVINPQTGFPYPDTNFYTNQTHEAADYYRAALRVDPFNVTAAHGLLRTYYERMVASTYAGHNANERAARERLNLTNSIITEINLLEGNALRFYTNATDELNLLTTRPLEAQLFDGSYPHINSQTLATNRIRLTEAYARTLAHQADTIFQMGRLKQFNDYRNPLIYAAFNIAALLNELAGHRAAIAERQLLLDLPPELTRVARTELGRCGYLLNQIQSLESAIESGRVAFVASRETLDPENPVEVSFEEYAPNFVPFLRRDNDSRASYEQLLEFAGTLIARAETLESEAAQFNRQFDVDGAALTQSLHALTNRYYQELGTLCGWIQSAGGGLVPDVVLALYPRSDRLAIYPYSATGESLGEVGSQWTRIEAALSELQIAEQDLDAIYSQMEKKSEVAGEIAVGIDNLSRMFLENGEKLEGLDMEAGKLQGDAAIERARALQSSSLWSGIKKAVGVVAAAAVTVYTGGAAAPAIAASGYFWGGAVAQAGLSAYDAHDGNQKSMKAARIEQRLTQNLAKINAQRTRIATLEKVAVQNQQRDQLLLQTEEALHSLLLQAERQKLTILLAEQRVGSEFLALQNLVGRVQSLLQEFAGALALENQNPLRSPDYRLVRDIKLRDAEEAFTLAHRWAFLAARSIEYRLNTAGPLGTVGGAAQSVLRSRNATRLEAAITGMESDIAGYFIANGPTSPFITPGFFSIRHHLVQQNLIAPEAETLPGGGKVDTFLRLEQQADGLTSSNHWLLFLRGQVVTNANTRTLNIYFATDLNRWPELTSVNPLFYEDQFVELIRSANSQGGPNAKGVEVQFTGRNLSLGGQAVRFRLEQRGYSQVRITSACLDQNLTGIRYWELRKPARLPQGVPPIASDYYAAVGEAGVNAWNVGSATQLDEFSPANSLWRLTLTSTDGTGGNLYLLNNLDKIEDIKIRFWTRGFTSSCP